MKVVTADQMRRIDQECLSLSLPTEVLMENAGKAVAEETKRILGTVDKQHILILIGPGNNGGDGLVAARYLYDWGAQISLYLFGNRKEDDPNLISVNERDISLVEITRDKDLKRLNDNLSSANVVIDALLGTGTSRPLANNFSKALESVNEAKSKNSALHTIALDLPTGLNADTGAVDPACFCADNTITLAFPKVGLFNPPGIEKVGNITVSDIGIPPYLAEDIAVELITPDWVSSILPERPIGANKGTFGRLLVVAGSINYLGAAYLACSGALRVGAGLVTLAIEIGLLPVLAPKLTEVTYLPLPETDPGVVSLQGDWLIRQELKKCDALLMGCGMGQSKSAVRLVKSILLGEKEHLPPTVLDADALNILSTIPDWWQQLTGNVILTPHPGEMSRLTGMSVAEIQSDRIGITKNMAVEWQKTVVLKGAYTVIADPVGNIKINPVANPGLASAGTGDVLSGTIAGLLSQGIDLDGAASCGVYLHSQAGEVVKTRLGDAGMIASDLLPELPLVIKTLKKS